MALNYNALTALTQKKYLPKLVDNFFTSHPILALAREKFYETWEGEKIVEPLIYGELGHVKSYKNYDTISYDTALPITAAEFEPKNLVAPIIIDEDTERRNNTTGKVKSLLEAKMQIAEETLKKQWATQFYGDGTGNGSKDLDGIRALIADTGTVGGIDSATYTWWKSTVNANGGSARALTTDLLDKTWNTVSDGTDVPDLHLVSDKVWLTYSKLLAGKLTFQGELTKKLVGWGFEVLEYRGKPVVRDKDCPNGYWFMINTKYFKVRYHPSANFKLRPWRPADNQIAKKCEILWSGNMTISNRRRFGLVKDISTSDWD